MPHVQKDAVTRIIEVKKAWENMRPDKSFYGLTLDAFKLQVKPLLDALAEIADLESRLKHAISKREAALPAAMDVVQGVISAVKGDPQEREDGELYAAMGYVARSKRSTGLKRLRKPKEPVPTSPTLNGAGA